MKGNSLVVWYLHKIHVWQGVLSFAIGMCVCKLSDSPLTALIAQLSFTMIGLTGSRTALAFCLREAFGVPLLIIQMFYIIRFTRAETNSVAPILIVSTLLGLCWQFTQFIILLQAIAVLVLYLMKVMPLDQTRNLLQSWLVSMFLIWYIQYYSSFVLCSIAMAFLLAVIGVLQFEMFQINEIRVSKIISLGVLILVTTVTLNTFFKWASSSNDDGHIMEYLLHQFGIKVTIHTVSNVDLQNSDLLNLYI